MSVNPALDPALVAELDGVSEHDVFLGPDGLDAELARVAGGRGDLDVIGTSRQGRPIRRLTIGDGPREAVVFGLPHPNEPIGGLTALWLARRLAQDGALGLASEYRWHIVPCVDPDGLALNDGWLRGPYTLGHYARHFFRPAGDEQVEWTFPFSYKRARFDAPLPETLALRRVIDDTRPAVMASLHNSELGGAYSYLSRPEPGLYPALTALPGLRGIDLHVGEPEAAFIEVLADGVHLWPRAETTYDHLESLGLDPVAVPSGSASSSYAGDHYGTLTLVSELPYWRDPRASDHRPVEALLADLLAQQADGIDEVVDVIRAGLASLTSADIAADPLLRSVAFFAPFIPSLSISARRRVALPESDRRATAAEQQSIEDVVHSHRLRYVGMLRRGLEAAQPGHAVTRDVAARHESWLAEAAEAHAGVGALPIRDLVAVQYGSILAAARHVATPD